LKGGGGGFVPFVAEISSYLNMGFNFLNISLNIVLGKLFNSWMGNHESLEFKRLNVLALYTSIGTF
jgi:hypothetical protein